MASEPARISFDAEIGSDIPGSGDELLDFRQRIAAMPRLLDDSDLQEFRKMGIDVGPIRRARREYVRELLRDLERESARLAGLMALAPHSSISEIEEFRRTVRAHILRLRGLAILHGLGVQVGAPSRQRSAALNAVMLGAGY